MTPPGKTGDAEADGDARRLLHELQVHQVELEQQNEELQATRQQLSASLKRYVDLYEDAPVGLATMDRNGSLLVANRRCRALLGDDGTPPLRRALYAFLDSDTATSLQRQVATLQAPGQSCQAELALPPGPAGRRTLRAGITRHPEGDDRLLLVLEDITERVQAQAEVEHLHRLLELSSRVSRTGFHDIDVATGRVTWSAMAREMLGAPAGLEPTLTALLDAYDAAAEGEGDGDGAEGAGAPRESLRRAVADALTHGRPFDLELTLRGRPGAATALGLIGRPLMEGERVLRLHIAVQDIQARRQLEAARLAQARAEAANTAKSNFLSRMSHELRTPLNAILGFSELMIQHPAVRDNAPLAAQNRHVFHAGQHLLALVDDLLDLARIEADRLAVHNEPLAADALVSECLGFVAPLAERGGVALRWQPPPLPCTALADPTRLRQVLMNLLGNAVRYSRNGGAVTVSCSAEGGTVRVSVHDSGAEIPAARLATLFEPLQHRGPEARGNDASSLGLALSRQLTQAMGGTLDAIGGAGGGTRFELRLPGAAPVPASAAEPPAAPRPAPPPGSLRVLYIEDHPANVALVQQMLAARPNLQFSAVTDGHAGLEAVRKLRPGLALVNIGLPGMDGYGLMRHIRADPALDGVRCVAVSADALAADRQRAHNAGFDDYLVKPFTADSLLAVVDGLTR